MDQHLWLTGMMGSGKSAAARTLGGRWTAETFDTDTEVSTRTGGSIAQLWGERGEQAFREMESAAVHRLATRAPAIIATGGGAVLDPDNVAAMRRSGRVVWLSADPSILSERVGNGAGRPLLDVDASEGALARILGDRAERYAAAADLVVDTDGLSVAQTADRIEAWWNES